MTGPAFPDLGAEWMLEKERVTMLTVIAVAFCTKNALRYRTAPSQPWPPHTRNPTLSFFIALTLSGQKRPKQSVLVLFLILYVFVNNYYVVPTCHFSSFFVPSCVRVVLDCALVCVFMHSCLFVPSCVHVMLDCALLCACSCLIVPSCLSVHAWLRPCVCVHECMR